MNMGISDSRSLASKIRMGVRSFENVNVIVCPSFISLSVVKEELNGSPILVGAQNTHEEDKGAYTGEISPSMLAPLCTHVIVGHSERRRLFGETDSMVNSKIKGILRWGLTPILCVSGDVQNPNIQATANGVTKQLTIALDHLDSHSPPLIVAYEPLWAIGTGKPATARHAQSMLSHIRQNLVNLQGPEWANSCRLIYGGSVTDTNVNDYLAQPDIHGVLIGGASIEPELFVEMVRIASGQDMRITKSTLQ